MKRLLFQKLIEWKDSARRKPIILRGARQVGKTHLVRQLGETFEHYVELNLEKRQDIHSIFEGNLDPVEIVKKLSVIQSTPIIPGKTLLFIDEAQACPRSLIALRYFYEEMPNLHVLAAGSLLDFAIEKVGVPVGRVAFMYMYPMSFIEYLWSCGREMIVDEILRHDPSKPIMEVVHKIALECLSEYMMIGGMPEVVATWHREKQYQPCFNIMQDIINAYRQDFEKYAKHHQIKYLETLISQVPTQLSQPFNYSAIEGDYRKRELSPCIDLLEKANVLHRIHLTSAQGRPLLAQSRMNRYKIIMLDVALTQMLLGLDLSQWVTDPTAAFVNQGALTEAFIGQELLVYQHSRLHNHLYYWKREASGSSAELDYMLDLKDGIIPIEVKAGHGSSLKSMHLFLDSHPDSPYGIRFSTHNFSHYDKLHSYPLYAVARVVEGILN